MKQNNGVYPNLCLVLTATIDKTLFYEVYTTIDRIIQYPEAWSPMSKNTRRCLVNRFPFGVIYQVKSGFVRIIAVADLRRRPDYWLDRG